MTHATTLPQFELTPGATSRAKALTATEPDIDLSALSEKNARKVVLPTMEGLCFEKVKHIAYLEANGNYTSIHFTDKRQILVCKTLREVEALLPQAAFARIHRSHTIHLRHIKKYVRGKGGHVVLQNGAILSVSTGQKDAFIEALRFFYRMP
ncbi:MAG: LytTR family transcriptional regulator [Chitinophagales bacterium]|jgi:two-component system, LytTR family, response regulator|nr:LytTR family transcriptional regulator [Chitinophagales bacterium]